MKRFQRLTFGTPCTLAADVFYSRKVRREQRRAVEKAEGMFK
jgi:hypothetical protein